MSSDAQVSGEAELLDRLEQARHGMFYNQVAVANVADILALRNVCEQLRNTVASLRMEAGLARAEAARVEARLAYLVSHDRRLLRLNQEYEAQAKKAVTTAPTPPQEPSHVLG